MPEEMLVRHCAPTLMGLKTGNMFSCRFETKEEEHRSHGDRHRTDRPHPRRFAEELRVDRNMGKEVARDRTEEIRCRTVHQRTERAGERHCASSDDRPHQSPHHRVAGRRPEGQEETRRQNHRRQQALQAAHPEEEDDRSENCHPTRYNDTCALRRPYRHTLSALWTRYTHQGPHGLWLFELAQRLPV